MKKEQLEIATFGNGCFWCTEAVFQKIKGVKFVISGFTGGHIKNPTYKEITTGKTGHAEVIQVTFNPALTSYIILLEIFFATHDPTTLNRQGYDIGTQYRSEIFCSNEIQKQQATEFITLLESEKIFKNPIVTKVSELDVFYKAEKEHQDFYNNNLEHRYCQLVIQPKIDKINSHYTNLLKT